MTIKQQMIALEALGYVTRIAAAKLAGRKAGGNTDKLLTSRGVQYMDISPREGTRKHRVYLASDVERLVPVRAVKVVAAVRAKEEPKPAPSPTLESVEKLLTEAIALLIKIDAQTRQGQLFTSRDAN